MEILRAENLSKSFTAIDGKVVAALRDMQLTIAEREFVSFIGPSGCGKTTLLKVLAGLLQPSRGRIYENGRPPQGRITSHGVVFQTYSLFPWLTVEQNVAFGLTLRGTSSHQQRRVSSHYIDVVGLRGFERAYPKELSGGMQQRAALARAFATNPKILFMDEPFSALDTQTRRFMQDLLLQLWNNEPRTVLFVTHDVDEAVFLSDTVYIMTPRPGTVRERVTVDLPRPRTLKTEFTPGYLQLKKHVQEIITEESLPLTKLNLAIYKDLQTD